MRILTDVEHLGTQNGAAVVTYQIVSELARRGHELDVVHIYGGDYEERYRELARSVTQVPKLDVYGLADGVKTLPRLLPAIRAGRAAKPDVIYDTRYWSLAWAKAVGATRRRNVVCHVHGFIDAPGKADQLLVRGADQFIAVSQFVADGLVERGATPSRVRVVHNGIDPDAYPFGGAAERDAARNALDLPRDAFTVLFLGRVHPNKGLDVLVQAMRALPDAHLLVCGGADSEDYLREVLAPLSADRLHHLPPRQDVVTPMHAADVVAVPSRWDDPFPRVVQEAMSTGRPVVGAAVGGIPEALTDGFERFLFPREDADALAARLTELRDWQVAEPELALACRNRIVERYGAKAWADDIEDILKQWAHH
ncbi:MAG TPA: glycosyltransferase family 4 protein [Mycobacteriales bacterium]|nr:glycosyltransferase family 4 protein [Mycobacteriales bacterium]